jgi:hypothetical protein
MGRIRSQYWCRCLVLRLEGYAAFQFRHCYPCRNLGACLRLRLHLYPYPLVHPVSSVRHRPHHPLQLLLRFLLQLLCRMPLPRRFKSTASRHPTSSPHVAPLAPYPQSPHAVQLRRWNISQRARAVGHRVHARRLCRPPPARSPALSRRSRHTPSAPSLCSRCTQVVPPAAGAQGQCGSCAGDPALEWAGASGVSGSTDPPRCPR